MKRLRQTVLDVAGYLVVMVPLLVMTLFVMWMAQIGKR
jgi:hypothetical protein